MSESVQVTGRVHFDGVKTDIMLGCQKCSRNTKTNLQFVGDDIMAACATCGKARVGKPYISKNEFKTLQTYRFLEPPNCKIFKNVRLFQEKEATK